MYALKPDVALDLALASRTTPKYYIDDAYVTGIIRQRLGYPVINLGWNTPPGENYYRCTYLNQIKVMFLASLAYPKGEWPLKPLMVSEGPRSLDAIFYESFL